jgi:hypothetical protein
MFLGQTLSFSFLDSLMVIYQSEIAPDLDEWAAGLQALQDRLSLDPAMRVFVVSDGGVPDLLHRRMAETMQRGLGLPGIVTAVLSDSVVGMMVTRIIRWFNPLVRQFPMADTVGAFAYLAVAPEDQEAVLAQVVIMRERMRAQGA